MIIRTRLRLLGAAALVAGTPLAGQAPRESPEARVARILDSTPLIDGHNDFLFKVWNKHWTADSFDFARPMPDFMTDLPRLRRGRVGAQFWAVHVPVQPEFPHPFTSAQAQLALFRGMVRPGTGPGGGRQSAQGHAPSGTGRRRDEAVARTGRPHSHPSHQDFSMRFHLPSPIVTFFATGLLVAPASAQTPPADRLAARIDSAAHALIASKATPSVSIAISRSGRTVYAKAFGTADLEQHVAATPGTVYLIGSVTKQFTAAAVLSLAEDGKLSLDDPLGKFLPDWPAAGRAVTVRQLLNHTSGIKDYTGVPRWLRLMALPLPHDSMFALFRDEPMDFVPGAEWRYDNSGYYLLGVIIEKVSGQKYAEYLDHRLFGPLGLKATRYCTSRSIVPGRTPGYNAGPDGFTNAAPINVDQAFAAGALCSTASDLLAWTRALEAGRAVKPDSYRLMTTPLPLPGGQPQTYGFGLGVGNLSGHRIISHNGGINGFNAYLASYPDDSLIVAVLVNVEAGEADKMGLKVSRWALGIRDAVVKDLPVAAEEAARVVGHYAQGDTRLEVRIDGGHLMAVGLEKPTRLLHQGGGVYRLESNPDFQISFIGSGPTADAMAVTIPGGSLTLPRVP